MIPLTPVSGALRGYQHGVQWSGFCSPLGSVMLIQRVLQHSAQACFAKLHDMMHNNLNSLSPTSVVSSGAAVGVHVTTTREGNTAPVLGADNDGPAPNPRGRTAPENVTT
jgi:hypothetical protein